MGAAASVQSVYKDALKWLKSYIDKKTYLADFEALDIDHNGGLSFVEFQKWISSNAEKEPDSCWSIFLTSGIVLSVAHKAAAEHIDSTSNAEAKHVVDVSEFRALLIHLYATSIIWRHFIAVLNLNTQENEDLSHKTLNEAEFNKMVRSFCNAHCQEELTDEVISTDFKELDKNMTGNIGFITLCSHCVKYMDMNEEDKPEIETTPKKAENILGVSETSTAQSAAVNALADLKNNPKGCLAGMTVEDRTEAAMDQVKMKIEKEDEKIKQFLTNE
eukprot:TRINITY_DN66241_c6_g1_i1.p2 TRINITY_DN66241_c6_g1~~TRINITY_DN66241_c6_g1_i1.p2  ORF type:complete len:274 (-),score=6.75 TRINITY_DN66241_c6_g1_i1:1015-1836(-)